MIYILGDWGIGDWGLGIGDWAQAPIPNPQSPIPKPPLNSLILKRIEKYFTKFFNIINHIKKYNYKNGNPTRQL